MKKPDTYQIALIVGLIFVVLFYIYDYYYLHLPQIVRYLIGVSFLFIAVISTVIVKARLGESSRVSLAKGFGKVISHDDVHLNFERNNISFLWEPDFGGHKISFYLPTNNEFFSIRQQDWGLATPHKSLLEHMMSKESVGDSVEATISQFKCISVSNVSGKFVLQSKNAEFLQQLLNNENVKNNLNQYVERKIRIIFNGSVFEMKWKTGSNEETEDFRQICHTGIVFQEAMTKLL